MKKFRHIMMIFAVVVLAAGCSKVEVVNTPEKEISFTVGNYAPATKAVVVTEFTSFKSKGYLYAEGVADAQNFFGTDGETITFNGTDTWAPQSHPYYWPKSANSYINFISWYANNGSADFAPSTASETEFKIIGRTIGANDNILIADAAWHQTNNQNQYYTVGVPTLFHHVLSRVNINVRATSLVDSKNANVTYVVTIQDAILEGVCHTGTMELVNTKMTSASTSAWQSANGNNLLWSADTTSAEDIDLVSANTNIGTAATAILPERSFMPQTLGDDVKLVITYTITTKSGNTVTSIESDIPATIVLNKIKNASDIEITEWTPNKKYTYSIAINPAGDAILINPVLETDWALGNYYATVE